MRKEDAHSTSMQSRIWAEEKDTYRSGDVQLLVSDGFRHFRVGWWEKCMKKEKKKKLLLLDGRNLFQCWRELIDS